MVHQSLALFTFYPLSFFDLPQGKKPLFDHIRGERERSVVLLTFLLAFDSLCAADRLAWHQQVASFEFSLFSLCFLYVFRPAIVNLSSIRMCG